MLRRQEKQQINNNNNNNNRTTNLPNSSDIDGQLGEPPDDYGEQQRLMSHHNKTTDSSPLNATNPLHESRQTRTSSLTHADLTAMVAAESMVIADSSSTGHSVAFGPYREVELESIVSGGGGGSVVGESGAGGGGDEAGGDDLNSHVSDSTTNTFRANRSNESVSLRNRHHPLVRVNEHVMNDEEEEPSNINTNNNQTMSSSQNPINIENEESNDIEQDVDESHWPSQTSLPLDHDEDDDDDYDENQDRPPVAPRSSLTSRPSHHHHRQEILNNPPSDQSSQLVQDDPSRPYLRLSKHVQSYLSATTTPSTSVASNTEVASTSSSQVASTSRHQRQQHREASTRQASSLLTSERTATTESDRVIESEQSKSTSQPSTSSKFEAKSALFWPLVDDYASAVPRQLKQQLELNANAREKLINLFTNHENYYTTMLAPIEQNYALTSSNKASSSSTNDDKQSQLSSDAAESSDESEKTSKLAVNIINPAQARSKRMRQIDDNSNSGSSIAEETNENRRSTTTSNEQNEQSSNRSNSATTSSSSSLSTDNTTTQTSNPPSTSSSSRVTGTTKSTSSSSISVDFHLCALCSHCLVEPVTLVCGCSFCKSCWAEYTHEWAISTPTPTTDASSSPPRTSSETDSHHQQQQHISRTTKRKLGAGPNETRRTSPPRCFTCSRPHEHNKIELLKPNVIVGTLVDRLWRNNVEIRRLRNDIRAYVCFCITEDEANETNSNSNTANTNESSLSSESMFDINLFEYLFNSAYTLDPSNHLILADLFILTYFYDCNSTSLKYARMASDLRSNWAFAYFMKAIYYEHENDFTNAKSRLLICLQLEPHIEPIRIKLYQLFQKSTFSLKQQPPTPIGSAGRIHRQIRSDMPGFHFDRPADSLNMDALRFDTATTETTASAPPRSSLHFDYSKYVTIDSHLVKPNELECSLCYRLLYHPVTTPCGHTFCLKCMERALDHRDQCPLCKHSLADYLAERRQFVTVFVDRFIRGFYANEHQERKRQHRDEITELMGDDNQIGIFVCTLAMPFAPCPLHVYEPRYRLMVRRAIESGRRGFGMVLYTERTPYRYAEYGCLLDIKTCQFLPDGRSILTTTGSRRFRVLDSSTRDGYNVARVEWVKDVRVEDEVEKAELLQLHDEVYRLALTWYSFVPETQKNRIMEIYGISELPLPEADIQTDNGPYWHWFLLNILPLDRDYQYKFLCKTSLKERLKQMKKIIMLLMASMRNLIVGTGSANQQQSHHHQQGHQMNETASSSLNEMPPMSVSSSASASEGEAARSTNNPTQMDHRQHHIISTGTFGAGDISD